MLRPIINMALAILALLTLGSPALAQSTKAQLNTEVSSNFPDNTSGLITPAILRTTVNDFISSWQQAPRVNAQSGTTYTVVVGDYGYLVKFSNASPVAVTLPQATGSFATFNFMACNRGAGAVTITPTTSTINGASSLVLQQNQCSTIVSDGTNYQIPTGSVQPVTCSASNWINAISSAGVPTCARPAFSDISGFNTVNNGGTGLTGGTSGGVPYFSSASTMASSGALTQYGIVYGGGAGGSPATTAAMTDGQVLVGQTGAAPLPKTVSGDATFTAAGAATVSKVNGVAYPTSPSTNTVPVVTSSNQMTYEAVPNAALANSTITLNAGSGVGLTAPGSMALGSTNTIGSTSDTPRFAGLGLGCASSGANLLSLCGSSSGKVDLKAPAVAGSNTITFPAGTTDFSATGGTSQVVKQTAAGGAFTVAQLSFTDISSTVAAAQIATTTITGQTVNNSPSGSNDYIMYYSAADGAVRRCTVAACTSAATAGVSSLNGLTGGLSIVNGTGISVSAVGSSITVANTGILGALGATDNVALRADGTGGVTAQGSALVIADTTGSLSRSGGGGIPIEGTNTNDSAASGYVGEYQTNTGTGVALTTNVAADITSKALTAGDWECWGTITSAPSTSWTKIAGWINTTSVTQPSLPGAGANMTISNNTAQVEVTDFQLPVGRARVLLSGSGTVYLSTLQTFLGTNSVSGFLGCRRMR